MAGDAQLRLRLKHCLQTILDFKDDLNAMPFGLSFSREFSTLEELLSKLEEITVNEQEVQRVELATMQFLKELDPLLLPNRPSVWDASTMNRMH